MPPWANRQKLVTIHVNTKDTLYTSSDRAARDFRFDDSVADVFPDMIQRSVPGYTMVITMTEMLAKKYGQPGSILYDLGCSLGASTAAMQRGMQGRACDIIAVDNSAAMLQRCEKSHISNDNTQFICADICTIPMAAASASMVVLNFTLQFLLAEKIRFAEAEQQAFYTDLYHDFKRANGYSDGEITQKRAALANILRPETLATHQQRLSQVGFNTIHTWLQCISFASLFAIK
jgi:tRNA (cmo5U34)-methyltransferase